MAICDCGKELSKGNKVGKCQACYLNRNKGTNPDTLQSQDLFEGILSELEPDTVVSELKVIDFVAIFRKEVSAICSKIDARVVALENRVGKAEDTNKENTEKVESLSTEVSTLKRVIQEQQKALEASRRKDLSKNIIVSGIPNDPWTLIDDVVISDDAGKLEEIFRHIDCSDKLSSEHKIISFPAQNGKSTHTLKVQFLNEEIVKDIIPKAKGLKSFDKGKVYINYDEPFYSRKENLRLRKKKYNLLEKHPNDVVKIAKGKLYHNDTIVDRFNISNQLF